MWLLVQTEESGSLRQSSFSLRALAPRLLLFCAALLAYPALTAAQPAPLTVQGVRTQDTSGNVKTTFAPGEPIQFAAELNNSYGGTLPSSDLSLTTTFYNDDKKVDIPPGVSTWTWNATAPSAQQNFIVTVKAFDSFYGASPTGMTNFTVGSPT